MSDPIATGAGLAPKQPRRWTGPALLASLVVNLFLIGLIGASLFFLPRSPAKGELSAVPSSFFRTLHKDMRELSAADKAALREVMRSRFPAIRPDFVRIETARKELAEALASNPFDAEKVGAAFDRVDAAQSDMMHATRDALIQGFASLEPAQRARIAEAMRAQAERRLQRKLRVKSDSAPGQVQEERAPSASQ
ncbi:MAG TPA: periplasmic heavy metal sensor [Parvibaculum sp.]|uniref:periplasmic heavy metal sensor n=1 Tax=Parvibaculum sp. TaxID=2024848 RepID=UPI002C454556|nr:periplasmic heavy metal sensor [Parvibaculum sp.]HMM13926.1 periplasmic heavy metal sensor [Parvibaculum sp.]